jgi:hypothetical protein
MIFFPDWLFSYRDLTDYGNIDGIPSGLVRRYQHITFAMFGYLITRLIGKVNCSMRFHED